MNKRRRAEIAAVILAILSIKQKVGTDDLSDSIDSAAGDVRSIRDDELESLNNMPENLEGSQRYDAMEAAVDNLEDAMDALDDALRCIEDEDSNDDVVGCLDDAIRGLERASV